MPKITHHEILIDNIASMIQCEYGDTLQELRPLARKIVRMVKARLINRIPDTPKAGAKVVKSKSKRITKK